MIYLIKLIINNSKLNSKNFNDKTILSNEVTKYKTIYNKIYY